MLQFLYIVLKRAHTTSIEGFCVFWYNAYRGLKMSSKFLNVVLFFNRFEIAHKIDEDIEYAISEQRRLMEYSGPLDRSQEQEQTERKALLSKIERYKSDLSPEHDFTEKIIKKNIKKWQRQSYGSARFWLCGCRAFDDAEEHY